MSTSKSTQDTPLFAIQITVLVFNGTGPLRHCWPRWEISVKFLFQKYNNEMPDWSIEPASFRLPASRCQLSYPAAFMTSLWSVQVTYSDFLNLLTYCRDNCQYVWADVLTFSLTMDYDLIFQNLNWRQRLTQELKPGRWPPSHQWRSQGGHRGHGPL